MWSVCTFELCPCAFVLLKNMSVYTTRVKAPEGTVMSIGMDKGVDTELPTILSSNLLAYPSLIEGFVCCVRGAKRMSVLGSERRDAN